MGTAALLALAVTAVAVLYIIWGLRVRNGVSLRTALIVLVVAVFAGLVIIYYPVSYRTYSDAYSESGAFTLAVMSLLQCMQNAFRTFVLDGSWSELLPSGSGDLQIPLYATVIGLFLNVFAPLLTFSAILSMFKEITSRLRVRSMASRRRPLFLFSELNRNTILLAQDIRRKFPKANLVYTDVYPEDDEANYELREQAAKLNAVTLRTDISELDFGKRKGLTEYFLLGHDEDENVMQARKLFKINKDRPNTGIYVLSVRKGNGLIIDSLASSLDVEAHLKRAEANHWDYEALKENVRGGGLLKFRRVDPERQIAWRSVPKIECIKRAFSAPYGEKETLSFLVIADTYISYSIVKTLLWFCQSDRFRLELNIVYADDKNSRDTMLSGHSETVVNIKSLMELECPDIIRTNRQKVEGESFYDIEFIRSSSIGSGEVMSQLTDIVSGKADHTELADRLLRTDAVIVDRGSDGESLETAAYFRTAFGRAGMKPEIYAVCADEDEILTDINSCENIVTYKDESFDIRLLGRRFETYKYDNIRNTEEEYLGFCQHIKWIDVSNSRNPSETRDTDLKRELLNYERHEYFRSSSISRAMYLRNALCDPDMEITDEEAVKRTGGIARMGNTDENTKFELRLKLRPEYECLRDPKQPSDRWFCTCDNCLHRRELEHNRWNAYMRIQGYIPSPEDNVSDKRAMAKVHGNLVPFGELDEAAREKDG